MFADKLVLQPICIRDIQSYVHVFPQESLQAVQSMMTALDQLNDWMKVNRLRLNQGKTQFM